MTIRQRRPGAPSDPPRYSGQRFPTGAEGRGFTLVEMIAVIVLVGVLAAFVAPRLSLTEFRQAGFFQQALSAVRLAQKLAVASGCHVQVSIDSAGCRLTWQSCGPASGTIVANPASGLTNFCDAGTPAGTVSASFSFDNIGRPSTAQSISIGTRTITVEAQTGYTRET